MNQTTSLLQHPIHQFLMRLTYTQSNRQLKITLDTSLLVIGSGLDVTFEKALEISTVQFDYKKSIMCVISRWLNKPILFTSSLE